MAGNLLEAVLNCGCCGDGICCPSRDCPGPGAVNPLPTSLTIELTASFPLPGTVQPPNTGFTPPPPSDCFDFLFTLYLIECRDTSPSGAITYAGSGCNACTWCGNNYTICMNVILTCRSSGAAGWILTVETSVPPGDCQLQGDIYRVNFDQDSCDPILLSGEMNECITCSFLNCQIGAVIIPGPVLVPVIATHPPFCLSVLISEDPP